MHHHDTDMRGDFHDQRRQRHNRKRERMAEIFAAANGPFGRHFGGGRFGRGFGDDGEGDGRRRGRFLGQGDIRLLVLSLIEEQPRHGYEIIKAIEDMSLGFYAPSPGVVYPTLTYLEEAGHVVAESEGNKKSYSITDEGRAFLSEERSSTDLIFKKMKAFAEKMKHREERSKPEGADLPRSIESALLNLRESIAEEIGQDPSSSKVIVRKLLELADDLK